MSIKKGAHVLEADEALWVPAACPGHDHSYTEDGELLKENAGPGYDPSCTVCKATVAATERHIAQVRALREEA